MSFLGLHTKYHELGGITNRNFTSGSPKSQIKVFAGLAPSEGYGGESVQACWLLAIMPLLWLVEASP